MAPQTPRRPSGARARRGAGEARPAARLARLRGLEPQRERRRRQLLEVAAHLVVRARDEGILAGLTLRVRLHTSRDFAGQVEGVRERSGARWRRPLRALGLSEDEANAVEECAVALVGRALRDDASREAEIATSVRAL